VKTKLSLILDNAPFMDALNEIGSNLSNLPLQVRNRLFNLLNFPSKLCRFENSATVGAGKITLKPSKALLDILAASRASKLDFKIVKNSSHKKSPLVKRGKIASKKAKSK